MRDQIYQVAKKRPVRVIARGKYTREIISSKHQWLDLAYDGKSAGPFVIYQAYLRGNV
jgi:hypothetical protein